MTDKPLEFYKTAFGAIETQRFLRQVAKLPPEFKIVLLR